jgi:hypothetical protein
MWTTVTRRGLMLVGLLASALSAGFFYMSSVMPGLSLADPQAAIRAMQGINREIRTPVFAFAFFGALVFPLAPASETGPKENPAIGRVEECSSRSLGPAARGMRGQVRVRMT